MKKIKTYIGIFIVINLFAGNILAKDWYIKAGTKGGKGTIEKPYKGIYKALDKALKGDVIHVAAGDYSGKLKAGFIIINTRNLTLLGGYNDDFTERNPFKYPTRIYKDKSSKAQGNDYGLVKTEGDYQGLIFDGFILDATNRNRYNDNGDLLAAKSLKKPPISLGQADTHLRNCIIINTAHVGVYVRGAGSSVENCLIVNTVYAGIQAFGLSGTDANETPVLLRNNTLLFNWKNGVNGGYGIDIGTSIKVTMENNIIGMNEAYAVSNFLNVESDALHSMINNAMFQNKGGHYAFYSADNKSTLVIDDPEDFEDSDLESAEDNIVSDPFYKYDSSWFEKFSNQTAAEKPGKVNMDDMNQMRSMLGLPVIGPATIGRTGWAMSYPLENVLQGTLWTSDNSELNGIGVNINGPFEVIHSKTVAKKVIDYQSTSFEEIMKNGDEYVDKAVAFEAWYVRETYAFHDSKKNKYIQGITEDTHLAIELRVTPEMLRSETILAYLEIGAEAEHYFKKKVQTKGGQRGTTTNKFIVKGIIKKPGGYIREGALVMEIIEMTR